ncbi:MAG: WhiB family transcriptional regulator [Acidimicrobiales bacterium]
MLAAEQSFDTESPFGVADALRGDEAQCRTGYGALTDLFYSENIDDIARAKALCNQCTLAELCFETAVAQREPYGVWGGQLFYRGKVLAVKRPRGRPPKNPRPDLAA